MTTGNVYRAPITCPTLFYVTSQQPSESGNTTVVISQRKETNTERLNHLPEVSQLEWAGPEYVPGTYTRAPKGGGGGQCCDDPGTGAPPPAASACRSLIIPRGWAAGRRGESPSLGENSRMRVLILTPTGRVKRLPGPP